MATKKAYQQKSTPRPAKAPLPQAPAAPISTPPATPMDEETIIARRSALAPESATEQVIMPPLKPHKRSFWQRLFLGDPAKKAMRDNLAAVKTGVLHEFETMSNHKGIPLSGSPFQNIMLPPQAKPRYGLKALVIVLFVCVFGAIMLLAGQLAGPEQELVHHNPSVATEIRILSVTQDTTKPASVQAQAQPTLAQVEPAAGPAPKSRKDVAADALKSVLPLNVLTAAKAVQGNDAILLTLTLENPSAQAIPAGPLSVDITDAAGRPLKKMTLALEAPIQAKSHTCQTWTIPLNASNKLDSFVKTVPLRALALSVRTAA
jgi:hypothetical protein